MSLTVCSIIEVLFSSAMEDFTPIMRQLVFDSNDTKLCIRVAIVDDFNLESPETFDVILSTLDSDVTISSSVGVVTILDNDMVGVGLEEVVYDASEEEGSVEICAIVRSGAIQRQLMAQLVTSDISAGIQ